MRPSGAPCAVVRLTTVSNYSETCRIPGRSQLGWNNDPSLIEWASHLAKLARIMQPNSSGVKLVEARCLLRQGQRDEGIRIVTLAEGSRAEACAAREGMLDA